jgi:uncharacterized protein
VRAVLENLAANWPYLVLIGLTGGFASALLGIGGGVIIVPMLAIVASASQREAQGLSLGYMILTALTGFLIYKYGSHATQEVPRLEYLTVGLLTAGGILGAFVGAWAANHVPSFWLRKIFALLMIYVAVKMMLEPRKKQTPPDPTQPVATSVIADDADKRS